MAVQVANLKYQLPGSNNLYVDLVDDEDVKLMFDEWADYLAEEGKASRNAKLHIYIDWQSSSKSSREAGMPSGGPGGLHTISETASVDTPVVRAQAPPRTEDRTSQEAPMGQSGHLQSMHNRYRYCQRMCCARCSVRLSTRNVCPIMHVGAHTAD